MTGRRRSSSSSSTLSHSQIHRQVFFVTWWIASCHMACSVAWPSPLSNLSPLTALFTWIRLPAGKPASFLLAGGCLQELHWFKQQYSSWLLDNSVLQGAAWAGVAAAGGGGIGGHRAATVLNPEPLTFHLILISIACICARACACASDGSLFLATPIDPLLVVLPLLEAARAQQNVFQDLEQILRCVGGGGGGGVG